ncbi:MAG: bifunctional enoyl-CoA hydratase/phosphate acetyltransferase [Pirellulales bacterium]
MDTIENHVYDEIKVGDRATLSRTLTRDDIVLFAAVSGDVNPAHVDEEFARSERFHQIVAHGMWGGALISTVLGTELPGPGAIYVGQTLRFLRPMTVGNTITITVTVTEKLDERNRVLFDCECRNQDGEVVITGTAEVIAPREKIRRPRIALPAISVVDRYARFRQLVQKAEGLDPIRMAIVHPVDVETLSGAYEAAASQIIEPILVGPYSKIEACAEAAKLDVSKYRVVDTEHSHAAAAEAVAMARGGRVDAIMKGSLASDELLAAARSAELGLRTSRQMSHVVALDVPNYPRPLFLTDTELHSRPNVDTKRDIVQNAVELVQALGVNLPKVAILSARERIDPRMESTMEAAALCKMAERGQIVGAEVDGPMPFETAVSEEAAQRKGVLSPVAGRADILVVPDLEAGQMLVKQLQYLIRAEAASLVLGARVPIVMTGPEDTVRTREAACAVASLLVHAKKKVATEGIAACRRLPLP